MMSKDIPDDIMETARECVASFDSEYEQNWPEIIALAILAERLRHSDEAETSVFNRCING
jgi:hypothetical protein